jgi:hypothetical protein
MLSGIQGWSLCVSVILVVWSILLVRKGPNAALGASIVLSFVFPVWLEINVAGVPISIRTAAAILGLLAFLFPPQRLRILSPLTLLDFCIGFMCVVHVISDSFAEELTPSLPFRAYGEWVLPYAAGRFAIRDRKDLEWIAPWVAGVIVILGIMSCVESLTKVNLFEYVFGDRPVGLAHRKAARLGFKRAYGPTTHPIFFGMLIVVLMPWLVCLWQTFQSKRARILTLVSGVIAFAGTVFTMSRTPVLTVFATIAVTAALRIRLVRWLLGLTFLLAVVGFSFFPYEVTDTVSRWSGGGDEKRLVEIDGKAVVSSSSRTRLQVFTIYLRPMMKAGPFGYGSAVTSEFPLSIPSMQGTFKSSLLFEAVDNAYVLLTLRFGWVGGICLAILFLTAIWTGLSIFLDRPPQLFAGTVAGMFAVFACFSLLLVFMNYDFGLPILWTMGVLSGLASSLSGRRF